MNFIQGKQSFLLICYQGKTKLTIVCTHRVCIPTMWTNNCWKLLGIFVWNYNHCNDPLCHGVLLSNTLLKFLFVYLIPQWASPLYPSGNILCRILYFWSHNLRCHIRPFHLYLDVLAEEIMVGESIICFKNIQKVKLLLLLLKYSFFFQPAWSGLTVRPACQLSQYTFYRCMLLFNQLHNTSYGSLLIPAFKMANVLAISVTSYSLIRLRGAIHLTIYLFFFLYLFTSVVIIFPGALLMSAVYNVSSNFHTNVKIKSQSLVQVSYKEQIWTQKTVDSLPVLKCTIGAFYHMEGVSICISVF